MSAPSVFLQLLPSLGIVLAVVCLWASVRSLMRRRLVMDVPTSKTTGVFIGLAELKGTAEAEQPLASYLAEQPCVYYDWTVEEHWSRTVVETYTDSDGKSRTRTRHESGWTNIARGSELIPFYLQDDCGVIRIVPEGATLQSETIFEETCDRFSPLYYGKGPPQAIPDSDHRRHFREVAIPHHALLYVMGQARERQDVVAAEIAQDPRAPMFLISTRTEEEVRSGLRWAAVGWGCLGVALSAAGWMIRDLAIGQQLVNPAAYVASAGIYGWAWLIGWAIMTYNSLVNLRLRVRQAWSQVDVQLKRRHDLIPNLVEMVKGLRDFERNVQEELAFLRSQMEATPPGQPGPDFAGCQPVLRAISERYPELKAQEAFLSLQQNLADTEQRIALARGYFNEIAAFYNTRLEVVPDQFLAAVARMQPQTLMSAAEFERAPVTVNLAT